MIQELAEKNVRYQAAIGVTASYLAGTYYREDDYDDYRDDDYERRELVKSLMPVAEKVVAFFGTAEEAVKALRFFHTVAPDKARDIIDGL